MAKKYLTDEEVEQEIKRLSSSEAVRLARKELRLKYQRRQALYSLRALEKRGNDLMKMGYTFETIDTMFEPMAESEEE